MHYYIELIIVPPTCENGAADAVHVTRGANDVAHVGVTVLYTDLNQTLHLKKI